MDAFQPFASPWWVNLLVALPFLAYFLWRKEKLSVSWAVLLAVMLFGIAFGYDEAVVVVYLRTAIGMPTGIYEQAQALATLPQALVNIEFWREAATMVMLLAVATVSAKKFRERAAIFLWAFAFWDVFYYVGLWLLMRWPPSLLSPDVLFLIPVPWLSQVWFPMAVSVLTIAAVVVSKKRRPVPAQL